MTCAGEADGFRPVAYSAALDFYLALYLDLVFRHLGWGLKERLTLSLLMRLGMLYVVHQSGKDACTIKAHHAELGTRSASAVASYKISTLEVLTFSDELTCRVSRMLVQIQAGQRVITTSEEKPIGSCPEVANMKTKCHAEHVSGAIICTMVEANVIIIAACAPTLHPAYEKARKWFSVTYQRRASTPTSPGPNGDGGATTTTTTRTGRPARRRGLGRRSWRWAARRTLR